MHLGIYALFEFNGNSSAEGYVNSTPNANVEIARKKNVRDFKFRKWNLVFRFLSGIKFLPIDPVFSSWINFYQISANHKLFLKFQGHIYFFKFKS